MVTVTQKSQHAQPTNPSSQTWTGQWTANTSRATVEPTSTCSMRPIQASRSNQVLLSSGMNNGPLTLLSWVGGCKVSSHHKPVEIMSMESIEAIPKILWPLAMIGVLLIYTEIQLSRVPNV